MARNCVAAVLRVAEAQERDPLQARIAQLGTRGHQSAQLAGYMALVSIAGDMRRIADHLERQPSPPPPQ